MTRRPFTGRPEDMYARDDNQDQSNRAFVVAAYDNGIIDKLFWPNYDAVPWHIQMEVNSQVINFWPHREKAHVSSESNVAHGIEGMFATVRRIECEVLEDFDVVEKEA